MANECQNPTSFRTSIRYGELCKVCGNREKVSGNETPGAQHFSDVWPVSSHCKQFPGSFASSKPALQHSKESNESLKLDTSLAQPTLPPALICPYLSPLGRFKCPRHFLPLFVLARKGNVLCVKGLVQIPGQALSYPWPQ